MGDCRANAWWTAAIVVAGIATPDPDAQAGEAARLGVVRTGPEHLPPRVRAEPLEPAPPAGHVIRSDDHLAYRLPGSIEKWAKLDSKLSHLCQIGAFRQHWPDALYAVANGVTYGVGFAEGFNLEDPQGQAKPGTVYFFAPTGTSRCTVLTAPRVKLTKFAALRFAATAPEAGK